MPFPIAQLLMQAGNARNAFVGGRRDAQQAAQQTQIAQALQMLQLKRQAQQDQLAQALQATQMRNIDSQIATRRPPPAPRDPVADHAANRQFDVNHPLPTTTAARPPSMIPGTPEWEAAEKKKAEIGRDFGYHPPTPTAFTPTTVKDENGRDVVLPFNSKTGTVGDPIGGAKSAGGGMGSAALKQKVGMNRALSQQIDDAIATVQANPKAFGYERGRGLPLIGGALDQRADPGGISARAKVSNIGSAKLHERSGAAVTAKEFPRLAPFVPGIGDTPEKIISNLTDMKRALEQETTELERTGNIPATGGGRAGGPGVSSPPSGNVNLSSQTEAEWSKANPPKPGESYEQYEARYRASVRP